MKRVSIFKRLLCMMLVIAIMAGYALPGYAVATDGNVNISFTKVDNSEVSVSLRDQEGAEHSQDQNQYAATDIVRVSIILEKASTIEAGYNTMSIATNQDAISYRDGLKEDQSSMIKRIEKALKTDLDVVWNLTLAANIISANVRYGQIKTIERLSGVKSVVIEAQYLPSETQTGTITPNMATSGAQIGTDPVWAAGYTGAGTRIAVIDTGTDTNHQSLNADAFRYALAQLAEDAGMDADTYIKSLDLLDIAEIQSVKDQLNVQINAKTVYINSKLPFAFNYADNDYDVTHDNDDQGEHGSHVAGIATANSYISLGDGTYLKALESVLMQGVAPEAQLITLKVFGKAGNVHDSDYMAAIEDAIILGCDSVNLSLGSVAPGSSRSSNEVYQAIMENLIHSGIVVTVSAGNSGSWVEYAENGGYLYNTDVSMDTVGAPASFTNSLAVASVENDGAAGYFVSVGDEIVVYNENLFNDMMAFVQIAGDYEYIFLDGVGTAEDWAAVDAVLDGKIAICSRGQTNFVEKATLAVDAGAIAVLIYNNTSGMINLDLTEYYYTAPVAALSQKQGAAIRALSTEVTDDQGNVLYLTGKMHISNTIGANQYDSDYYTMSNFSAWGIPGSLEMKPEITAPGGNIFSLNGLEPSGGGYEIMSGTSMASPQVAGMAALMAQYIRENDLVAKTGMSERFLSQSLLMSTAMPLMQAENAYYSILQQGAGLANINSAICADSYITMAEGSSAGAADGKIKVELGDDPDKTGSYSASFTLHNLYDTEKNVQLSADFFIQAITTDNTYLYMDTATALIGMDVSWTVNGDPFVPANIDGMDFNGDGLVNADDGQTLLNYATGIPTTVHNQDKADIDADGDIDSYDAYLFLHDLTYGIATLPAEGSVEVSITFSIPDDLKASIDEVYPNGTYIQGFLYAETEADEEGISGTVHSIPVLGFYGNWTDPSMFDVSSWTYYDTEEETRIPYIGRTRGNDYKIVYADDPDNIYSFGGNPITADDTYMPERNAINSRDMIYGATFVAIRNAAASRFTAVNATTGEILFSEEYGPVTSAFFYGYWYNSGSTAKTKLTPSSASEGDVIDMALTFAPEYYMDSEGNVDWDALGEGATFGISAVIDNTAPEIHNITLDTQTGELIVTASDNQYISAVGLYNKTGITKLARVGAKQDIEQGATADYILSLDDVVGKKFLIQVFDYAMNVSTYMLQAEIGEMPPVPEMFAYDNAKLYWAGFDKNFVYSYITGMPRYAYSDFIIYAATIAEHYVFACNADGDLYVMPENDMTDTNFIVNLGRLLTDMAYNKADGKIYGVDERNNLVSIDTLTGDLTSIGTIGLDTNTLACDGNGTFFCNEIGTGTVYSFTLETLEEPSLLIEDVGIVSYERQSMEVDPDTGLVYWISYASNYYDQGGWGYYIKESFLFEIDPATGEFTKYNDFWHQMTGLCIPGGEAGDSSWAEPTDQVLDLKLSKNEVTMLKDTRVQLSANVQPWTATDRTVTWTSSDESVATVNRKGLITGVGEGTAVITATSNLDPTISAQCTVTVELLNVTIHGTMQDEYSDSYFYSWNMATDETWTAGNALEVSMTSATYSTLEEVYYIMDSVTDSWAMHKVGADGKTIATAANPNGIPLWDMAYSEYFSQVNGEENISSIYYYYLLSPKNPMALNAVGFNLSSYCSYLTAITSMGYEHFYDETEDVYYDTEHLVLLDNEGYIGNFWIYTTEDGYNAFFNFYETDLPCTFPGDATLDNMYTSMVVGEDGALYVSAFTGETNELYRLVFNEETSSYDSSLIGEMGDDVWPATITSVTVNTETTASPAAPDPADTMVISATEITDGDLQAAASAKTAKEILNDYYSDDEIKHAVLTGTSAAIVPCSDSTVAEDEKAVTMEVTNDVDATNGVITVTWDTGKLALKDIIIHADYKAIIEEDGSITFGYVALGGITAGESVATLTFDTVSTDDSVIDVVNSQINNESGADEDVDVEFPHANTEIRDAVDATCTEDGYTGDIYCTDCGKLVEAGCIIPATGHTMTDPVFTWNDDMTACTVTYTCSCGATATEDALITVTTVDATCTENGKMIYTATCGEDVSVVEIVISATGHSYADGKCVHCGAAQESAETGDSTTGMILALMSVSIIGLAVLLADRRKLIG